MYVTEIDGDRDFWMNFWVLRLSWPLNFMWEPLWTSSEDKATSKHKIQIFLQKLSEIARSYFCICTPGKYLKTNRWLWSNFMQILHFKAVFLSTISLELPENAIEIQRMYCTAVHIAWPKETQLHKPSLSWQVIANLHDFCTLRLPWPRGHHSIGIIRRMPVSYWTSGGCQSEGPRGLRPLGPTDWHPPSVQ